MEKERLQEYAARVTQANRSELVVIIYEATIASIEEGKKYLSVRRRYRKRNSERTQGTCI